MIDLQQIRSVITDGLTDYLGIPVLQVDAGKLAKYPYITYSFTGPIQFSGSTPVVTHIAAGTSEVIERYTEQPTCRISFTSCSDQQLESMTNAVRMHDWFRILGHGALKQGANMTVAQTGEIKCRDTIIEGVWERRSSFYVTFRTTSVVEMNQTSIQTVNWK